MLQPALVQGQEHHPALSPAQENRAQRAAERGNALLSRAGGRSKSSRVELLGIGAATLLDPRLSAEAESAEAKGEDGMRDEHAEARRTSLSGVEPAFADTKH